MKTVFFTGGGSGGHVIPALTLISKLISDHPDTSKLNIYYIGSHKGVERQLVKNIEIRYFPISTGKLRRYFSFQNFTDIFRLMIGTLQSLLILGTKGKGKRVLFSTGGFVSVPVVVAAKLLGYKIFIHEQTSRVGLANKISSYFATKIFVSFEGSKKYFPENKTIVSGYPVRDECFDATVRKEKFFSFSLSHIKKPVLFITGGGNGSELINNYVLEGLAELQQEYFIIHQVGKKYYEKFIKLRTSSYHPVDLIGEEMIDLYKISDFIISRAGAGTVCELMALGKSSLFIPLKIAQRNEQFHNAEYAKDLLGSVIIKEEALNSTSLINLLESFKSKSKIIIDNGHKICLNGSKKLVIEILSI